MAPTSNGPYLDFPREVRLRIYHYLFHDTEISLAMHSDFGLAKCAPFESNSYSADDGITLVCRLVRAEAMPVLRRSISLYCEINNSTCTREGTLVVKSEYFKLIREAHIVLGDVGCHIPYHEMKSLEVLRLECDKEWLVLWWHPKLQDYVQWAKDSDLVKYVDSVKQTILEKWSNDKLRGMLSNPRRGFRIEWVECIYDEVIETDVWLTFDWDSLDVIEGAAGIQNAFDMFKKRSKEVDHTSATVLGYIGGEARPRGRIDVHQDYRE